MARLLRIRDWNVHFENNRTRDLKKLTWVPVPNSHDGDGFTDLMGRPNGTALFGAWVLILQVASKCDPRGTLVRDLAGGCGGGQTPHDAASLSRITRCPAEIMEDTLSACLEIGWLERKVFEDNTLQAIPQEGATLGGIIPQVPAEKRLWKGREGKGMEGKTTTAPPKKPGGSTSVWENACGAMTDDMLRTDAFKEAWLEWVMDRKERGKRITKRAVSLQIKKLQELGHDRAIESIRQSIAAGWAGLFDPKSAKSARSSQRQGAGRPEKPSAADRGEFAENERDLPDL